MDSNIQFNLRIERRQKYHSRRETKRKEHLKRVCLHLAMGRPLINLVRTILEE